MNLASVTRDMRMFHETLLKNSTVLTLNPRREIFDGADLLIDGDRIATR